MQFLKKVFPLLVCLGFLAIVIFFAEPPKSWQTASFYQILIFFIPLLLSFIFIINFFINYLPHAFFIGLGLMVLTVLLSTKQLNFITALVTIITTFLLVKFFPKLKFGRFRLPQAEKIPKINLPAGRRRGKLSRLGGKRHG